MKRIMSMAVAGVFVATAAFAQVGQDDPLMNQNDATVADTIPTADTIPAQDQVTPPATTFPTQTAPVETDTEPTPMVTEPTKTDDQMKVDEKDQSTNPALKQEKDTTETDTTDNGW